MTTVITGAAGRLGRVVVSTFSDLGHDVVGVDSNAADAPKDPCYAADLTSEESVRSVLSRIAAKHGGIDVLIHTVGTWDGQPIAELELGRWRTIMDVNLTSTFLVFREALRLHADRRGDKGMRLIAFASGQGADRGAAEQAPYSASKAGVVRLVESIAAEYLDTGVTAHAIAPSMILFEGMEDKKGIPVQDLANLCVVLAGDAGDSMSGTTIRAYGTLQ